MSNEGKLSLPTSPPHSLEIGFSGWKHSAFVRMDGRPVEMGHSWKTPGADWSLELPGVSGGPLQIQVRCAFERNHYPHSHLLVARWGDARLVVASGVDAATLLRMAQPPVTI